VKVRRENLHRLETIEDVNMGDAEIGEHFMKGQK